MYTYCPTCSGTLLPRDANYSECSVCKNRLYTNPKPTAIALLTNESDHLLIIRRGIEPFYGMLDIPGGFVNVEDESFEKAVQRELREEIGQEATDVRYFGSAKDIYPYQGIVYTTITVCFTGKISGFLHPDDDVAEIMFMHPDTLDYEAFAFSSVKEFLKKYRTPRNQ